MAAAGVDPGGLGDDGDEQAGGAHRPHEQPVPGVRVGEHGEEGGVGVTGVGLEAARRQRAGLPRRPRRVRRCRGRTVLTGRAERRVVEGGHGRPATASASGRVNAPR